MTLYLRNSSSGRFGCGPVAPGWILRSSATPHLSCCELSRAGSVRGLRRPQVRRLDPGEVALHPDVDEAHDEDAHEDEHLEEQEERKAPGRPSHPFDLRGCEIPVLEDR